jgi:hypothetical protein
VCGLSILSALPAASAQSQGSLAPPHRDFGVDTDGDGMFNLLRLEVHLGVSVPGTFYLSTGLFDSTNTTMISSGFASTGTVSGPTTVTVDYTGYGIAGSGIPGPYRVQLYLFDDAFHLDAYGEHTTQAYALSQFDPIPASFAPPHSDTGEDRDSPPDGLFNVLRVDVRMTVNDSGVYLVSGTLWDAARTTAIEIDSKLASFPAGTITVPLFYPGVAIRTSGIDGPYAVDLVLQGRSGPFPLTLDRETYNTSAYRALDFQPSNATVSGTVRDAWTLQTLYGISVTAYNYRDGVRLRGATDFNGYYQFPLYDGQWVFTYDSWSWQSDLRRVPVAGSAILPTVDLLTPAYTQNYENMTFASWEHFEVLQKVTILTDLATFRQTLDWEFGNRDQTLTVGEVNLLVSLFGGGPSPPATTNDLLRVDASPFNLVPGSSQLDLAGLAGPIDSPAPPSFTQKASYAGTTAPSRSHAIDLNVTYESGYMDLRYGIRLPGPYELVSFTAAQSVSVSGLSPGLFLVDPGFQPNPGLYYVWMRFVANSTDATAPTANAGPDRTVPRGTAVTFDGSGSTDNDRVANYTWTFTDNGPRTLYGASPTYTFDRLGTFTVTLTVRDRSGNSATDTLAVTVAPTTGTVRGFVRDPAGAGIAGATVRLLQGSSLVATATSAANGSFEFTDVSPGTYFVEAAAGGFVTGSQSATVVAGNAASVTVTLTREAPSGAPAWFIPVGAAAILAIVLIALTAAVLRSRKKRESKKPPEGPSPGT